MENSDVNFFNHRFGVEIEMVGLTRERAAKIVSEVLGNEYKKLEKVPRKLKNYENQFSVRDNEKREWKIFDDDTIYASKEQRVELVTPILTYKDVVKLKKIVNALKKNGAKVNETCGIHIHVDASVHNVDSINNMLEFIVKNQNKLKALTNIHCKERKEFCANLDYGDIQKFMSKKPKKINGIKNIFNKKGRLINIKNVSENKNAEKNTIEIRVFDSTLNTTVIEQHINFVLGLSNYCINRNRVGNILISDFSNCKKIRNKPYAKEFLKKIGVPDEVVDKKRKVRTETEVFDF